MSLFIFSVFFPSQPKFRVQNTTGKDFQRCQIPVLSCAFKRWSLYSVAPGPAELHVAKKKNVSYKGGQKWVNERPLLKWPARSDPWCHKKGFLFKNQKDANIFQDVCFRMMLELFFGGEGGEDSWTNKKHTEISPHECQVMTCFGQNMFSSQAPNCSFGSLVLRIWDQGSQEKKTQLTN